MRAAMLSMRSAMPRMPEAAASVASPADAPPAARRAVALLLQRLVGVRQFVGDDERRQEDQPRFADLAQASW